MTTEIVKYKHGRLIYFPGDPYMGRFLREHGEYSEGEVELFKEIVRPGDFVIEAGANIGCHTIPLAGMCHGGGIFAFEPQVEVYHALCGNLALNSIRNVLPLCMAAGAESGSAVVPTVDYDAQGVNFGGVSLLPTGSSGNEVPMMPLDMLLDQLPNLRLIKADVEGMEAEVLIGAQRLIREFRPILYLEDDRDEKREALHELVYNLDYRRFRHLPSYVADGGLVSINLLCVPREIEVVSGLPELE